MGCDGGTIPKRNEVVKTKQQRSRQERQKGANKAERWKQCALSDWCLKRPIVGGHLGHIFTKEEIIKHLLDYQRDLISAHDAVVDKAPALDTFHSMKDVKELNLKDNPEYNLEKATTSEEEAIKAEFVCPITGLETNGKYKFVFSWNCGCVVSERAVKEVPNDDKCLVCQKPYKPFDLITLNPDDKELEENRVKFLVRKMRPLISKDYAESSSGESRNSSQQDSEPSTSSDFSTRGSNLRHRRHNKRRHNDVASSFSENPIPSTSTSSPDKRPNITL